jgi:hypothetical protein
MSLRGERFTARHNGHVRREARRDDKDIATRRAKAMALSNT